MMASFLLITTEETAACTAMAQGTGIAAAEKGGNMRQMQQSHCFKPARLTLPLLMMVLAFFAAALLP